MLANHEKSLIIEAHLKNKTAPRLNPLHFGKMSDKPAAADLLKFSKLKHKKKWAHNRRYAKKFLRNWRRYVSDDIFSEFIAKTFASVILPRINYEELAKKIFVVEPLPSGAVPIYARIEEHQDTKEV